PATVDTPLLRGMLTAEQIERREKANPMGRLGRPEDVAAAVLFFASPRASYVTGQVLSVNGGVVRAGRSGSGTRGEGGMSATRAPAMDSVVACVRELDVAALPEAVVEAAGRSITDWLGTAIRGAREPLATSLAAVITASGGAPQATVVGRGIRTSALFAAL